MREIDENIIRIGVPLINGTNFYPMVKPQRTEVKTLKSVEREGVEVWGITFTNLDCTYVETRRHIFSEGPLPMDVFAQRPARDLYRGIVAHVDVDNGEEITLSDLEESIRQVRKGDALIVDANGYTDKWFTKTKGKIDTQEYNLGSPYFSNQAMKAIIDAETAILASNIPSFSNPKTEEGFGIDMIAEFYKTEENMIIAPLLNLPKIRETEVVLQVNPIEIPGCCGLPSTPIIYQGELKKHLLKTLKDYL